MNIPFFFLIGKPSCIKFNPAQGTNMVRRMGGCTEEEEGEGRQAGDITLPPTVIHADFEVKILLNPIQS